MPPLLVSFRSVSVAAHPAYNMHTRIDFGHGRHPPVSCRVLCFLPALHGACLASMSVPVSNQVASMATDPGLPGRLTTRTPSVTGISRRPALRRLQYETGRPVFWLSVTCAAASSLDVQTCPMAMHTRVPREPNVRRPKRVLRLNKQGRPAHAQSARSDYWASGSSVVGAIATGVGRRIAPARRKRSQRRRLEDGY